MDPIRLITEPRRRRILQLVWSEEMTAGEIADHFDVTFGAISQHLAALREAGFVTVRRDGNRRWYAVDRDRLEPFRSLLEAMWSDTLDRLAAAVEAEMEDDR